LDFRHSISLEGRNSILSFNKYIFFSFDCWQLHENFSDCPKNCVAISEAAAPVPPARTPIEAGNFSGIQEDEQQQDV